MRREYKDDGRRVRIPDGEPIDGYYPTVVDKAVFHRAREVRTARQIGGGQTGKRFSNIFTGIAKCGVCGASMHYTNKGKNWTYLHCSNAKRKAGNCTAHPWPYKDTEVWLLWTGIQHIDFREVYPSMVDSSKAALKGLETDRVTTEAELETTKGQLIALVDAITDRQDNPHLLDRLDTLTSQERELAGKLEQVEANTQQEQDRIDNAGANFEAVQDALGEWFAEQDTADDDRAYQIRSRLNQLLKRLISEIKFYPGDGPKGSGRSLEVQLKGITTVLDTVTGEFEESDSFGLQIT